MPRAKARPRGQLIKRGPDRWLCRVFLGRDPRTKKRLYHNETVAGTKAEALKHLTQMQADRDVNAAVTPNEMTVATLAGDWLAARTDIAESTKAQYAERIQKDILPYFGQHLLKDVTPLHIQRWITWLTTERHLSPRTVRYSYTTLNQMFDLARGWRLLASSPTGAAKLPVKTHEEMQVLRTAEMDALVDAAVAASDPLVALWALLLYGGFRPQEAMVFHVEDFDFTNRRVTVQRALSKDREGRPIISTTKTKKGRRTVSLPAKCMAIVRAHLIEHRIIGGMLFRGERGAPFLDLSATRRRWKRACRAASVPVVRLYGARHSHATALLSAGVNLKVVSERLGHSSIQVTADIYSHVLPEMDANAADIFDAAQPIEREAGSGGSKLQVQV